MKLLLKIAFLFVAINGFSQMINIDKALDQAGNNIGNSLKNDTTVAILNISTFSGDFSTYIINNLTSSILKTENLRIVSRQRISQILNELHFQMSGYVNDETAQRIGHMIGAQTVITGSITRIDNIYRLNIQCLEVETAIIQKSIDFDIQRDRRIKSFESKDTRKPIKSFNFDSVNLFENYNPFTTLGMIGFTYSPNTPLGFTGGVFGFYTSWNFAIPNWQGYKHDRYDYQYDGDGEVNGDGSYMDRNNRTYEIIDWTLGYNFNIIPRLLYIPIGFGMRLENEWRLFNEQSYSRTSTEWHGPASEWEGTFIFEIGLLLKIKQLYLSGTYRTNNAFSLSLGICEEDVY